jgi:phosphate transport system substrate-binding protein
MAMGLKQAATPEGKRHMNGMQKIVTGLLATGVAVGIAAAGDAQKIVVDGSTTVGPIAKAFAEYYMGKHPDVSITVSESGSGNGAKSLINGACNVATMSRPMKSSEKKAAQDAGVLPIEHIVALDGIAVVVHPSNPLANLTVEQIQDIFTGKIANWQELGGPDQPIVVISRDTNSGTYECFESLVMNKKKLGEKSEYVGSNGAIRQRVMNTPAAIGYVGLAFIEGVKAVTVNGIEASPDTVRSRKYPIARPLYMYTNGRPKQGTPLHDFINLSEMPEGLKIVEDTGYVPLK